MSTVVYGPDAFTVGSDTTLATYSADWELIGVAGGTMVVNAALDVVGHSATSYDDAFYRWKGTGSPTGDQQIAANLQHPASNAAFGDLRLLTRVTGTVGGSNLKAYAGELHRATATVTMYLYKVSAAGTFTELASGDATVGLDAHNCTLDATGTSTTALSFKVTGHTTLTYDDSSSPYTSGVCGLSSYYNDNNAFNATYTGRIDNVQITDLTPVSAAVTGTATESIDETYLKAADRTVIFTLTGDTFIAA